MENKILTISIAAYNDEKYIRQALESLIDDEIIDDLEVFVIDDGGSDDTLAIAQEYADSYPQSIFPIHKKNAGYGSTINTSIEIATGKYFKQLDGDDWFDTENLKNLIKIMREITVDCFLTGVITYDDSTGKESEGVNFNNIQQGILTLKQCGIKSAITMHSSAFRTKILKEMPYRLTEKCFYTDTEYCAFPIPYLKTLYVLHKDIYIYRTGVQGQSMHADGVARHYKDQEKVIWIIYDVYCSISNEEVINKELISYILEKKIRQYYQFLCILPASNYVKQEIVIFTQKAMKNCPGIMNKVKQNSKSIRVLIDSHSVAYPVLSWWIKRKWRKDGRLT